MERISSAGNRWIKLAAQLKIKKYRDRTGQFLMEGVRSAEDALGQGYRDAVCFISDEAAPSLAYRRSSGPERTRAGDFSL